MSGLKRLERLTGISVGLVSWHGDFYGGVGGVGYLAGY